MLHLLLHLLLALVRRVREVSHALEVRHGWESRGSGKAGRRVDGAGLTSERGRVAPRGARRHVGSKMGCSQGRADREVAGGLDDVRGAMAGLRARRKSGCHAHLVGGNRRSSRGTGRGARRGSGGVEGGPPVAVEAQSRRALGEVEGGQGRRGGSRRRGGGRRGLLGRLLGDRAREGDGAQIGPHRRLVDLHPEVPLAVDLVPKEPDQLGIFLEVVLQTGLLSSEPAKLRLSLWEALALLSQSQAELDELTRCSAQRVRLAGHRRDEIGGAREGPDQHLEAQDLVLDGAGKVTDILETKS